MNIETRGAFLDRLPPRPCSELRRIGLAAADASEALGHYCRAENVNLDEDELSRLEDHAFFTRQALFDYLLTEFGISTNEARRMAAVLL